MFPSRSLFRAGLILLSAGICSAGDDAQAPQQPDIEFIKCRVMVVDALGQPVQGAVVMPSGLRTSRRRGTHWGWSASAFGPLQKIKTDADGLAELSIPKYVMKKNEFGEVTWLVDDPEHVVYRADHDINADPAIIKLKDGYRITVTAIDAETQKPIRGHLYARQSGRHYSRLREWKQTKSGELLSRPFDNEQITLRLIALTPGQPARFSDLITLRRRPNGRRVSLHNIRLQPGTRLEGQIDAAVPRPVVRGQVVAYISAGDQPGPRSRQRLWTWSDETPCVFRSLRRRNRL